MAISCDVLVSLRGGPTVPWSVVCWITDAEAGVNRFRTLCDGLLHVGPRDSVQAEDLAFIREHRASVRACVAYLEALAPC
jgi:hypothetical protein